MDYRKIKTFEDACKALNSDQSIPDFSMLPSQHQKSAEAYCKLIIIAEALNNGWKPDWDNFNEIKYTPWFYNKSGFGLSYYDYVYWSTRTFVGSRLCFKSKVIAKYAATKFADLYNEFLTIK